MAKKPFIFIGLKGATPEQIKDKTRELIADGYRVEHRTHSKESGNKLPYNGILVGTLIGA